jgi:hypothetical protein
MPKLRLLPILEATNAVRIGRERRNHYPIIVRMYFEPAQIDPTATRSSCRSPSLGVRLERKPVRSSPRPQLLPACLKVQGKDSESELLQALGHVRLDELLPLP